MQLIQHYFPGMSSKQLEQFAALEQLYVFWNEQINVISRRDMEALYERHVLHSLGIAKVIAFVPGARILDVGTGGGFPGIPLAIMYPESEFVLVDSIGKKIKVVNEIVDALSLTNVRAQKCRAEAVAGSFDFVVTRAVTKMEGLVQWTQNKIESRDQHPLPNGILALKGGDLTGELKLFKSAMRFSLSEFFDEDFFETKEVVYLPI
ncbi:MAG: 16S rRNA (guanine(527)-N(7))-methyltransferase RsmG [Flavobacteriaceae bacterium]|nr:16S rRNA (guanine(527)-N(7))-methyltransferase RsmG [Flavobacteriaceae bacterium]MDG1962221.1 16S rRNA (guanine(527)-N(7))-methyltransferase RsmG [Flavobacteriaceae bacterium]